MQRMREVLEELIVILVKLKVLEGHSNKAWESYRQALKSVWEKENIDETKCRLDDFRSQLIINVVVNLR